jgi:hypothetical protein
MSRCCLPVAVGAYCTRSGPQSHVRRPKQQAAASRGRGSSFLFAIMGDGTRATHLGSPGLWCRVSCTTLGSSGTLVS